MSRLGRQLRALPPGTSAAFDQGVLTVKGPLGTITRPFKSDITFTIAPEGITLAPRASSLFSRALWGTYASHVANMIEGVTKGFSKKLIIEGIGYKMSVSGDQVVLALGLSHPVTVSIPAGIKVAVEKNMLTVTGIDKERVGEFTARIRAHKVTEPYKGKGIRYEGEYIRRKQGKKVVT